MTTSEARAAVEYDATGMGWTSEDLVRFRHCLSLLAEETGLEKVRLTGHQFTLFHAFPRRTRERQGSLSGPPHEGIEVPRALARFLDWWRLITNVHPMTQDEFDWVRAVYIFVTETETRRAWFALTELAERLDPLLTHLPRKRRA